MKDSQTNELPLIRSVETLLLVEVDGSLEEGLELVDSLRLVNNSHELDAGRVQFGLQGGQFGGLTTTERTSGSADSHYESRTLGKNLRGLKMLLRL